MDSIGHPNVVLRLFLHIESTRLIWPRQQLILLDHIMIERIFGNYMMTVYGLVDH
jgi:hypothetical protein